jgi:hypothetical protein
MKKVLLFAVSALTLFCSCERLFERMKRIEKNIILAL